MALYQAKAAGKNCYETFQPRWGPTSSTATSSSSTCAPRWTATSSACVYQPIYNLDDLALVGVEALLRWEHPTLGQIQPDEFIPLLEATGQIIEVGRWVLREACTQMAALARSGSDLSISVNVSGRQLDRDVIVDDVRDALERQRARPGRADHRDHRDRADAQRRRDRAPAARTQDARRPDRHRRLRHRLFQPGLPAAVPGRLPEDRSQLHRRDHAARPSPTRWSARWCSSARTSA